MKKMATYEELIARAEKEGISKEGIHHLLNYYTDQLDWGMFKALDYVWELFENGTMAEIMKLKGGKQNG